MKKILPRLLLSGLALLLMLGAAEWLLRVQERRSLTRLQADTSKAGVIPSDIPGLHYTLRPGALGDTASFNALGFNMPERPAAKPAGAWRLMVVGDSVVQGVGAAHMAGAWPNELDRQVRAAGRSAVEVWNCGTGGYNVNQIFLMLTRIVTNYSPDAVLYGFCFNDNWGPNVYMGGQVGTPAGAARLGRAGLLDLLRDIRLVQQARAVYGRLFYATRGYYPVYVDRKIGYPSWRAMKERIAEMRDFCRARGWPFGVVIIPMPQFIHVDDRRNLALRDLCDFLDREGIPRLDATPVLRAHRAEHVYVPLDNHPNTRGYALIAEAAAGWLTTNRPEFLPRAAP